MGLGPRSPESPPWHGHLAPSVAAAAVIPIPGPSECGCTMAGQQWAFAGLILAAEARAPAQLGLDGSLWLPGQLICMWLG